MIKTSLTLFLLALFALPALAQSTGDSARAQSPADDARAAAGCGPELADFQVKTDKKQHPAPPPPAGKAMVYILEAVRASNVTFAFGGITTKVGLDGQWVGANGSDSYFFLPVDPGEHRLCTNWQSGRKRYARIDQALTFQVEAGKTYYFLVDVYAEDGEVKVPHLKLEPLDPAVAQLRISTFSFSTSHQKNVVAPGK